MVEIGRAAGRGGGVWQGGVPGVIVAGFNATT